jgi:hypothetical protein
MVLHWLRVITLADLADPTGRYIPGDRLVGEWQAQSPLEWTRQPRPSKRDFALFRKFICNTVCLHKTAWQPVNTDLKITEPLGRWFTNVKRNVNPTCCRTKDSLYYQDDETKSIAKYNLRGNSGFFKYEGEVNEMPQIAQPVDCRFVDGDKLWTSRRYRPATQEVPERKRPGNILHDNLIRTNSTIKGASDRSLFKDQEVMTAGWILANDTKHMTAAVLSYRRYPPYLLIQSRT